jgi:hypothetical protein
MNANRVPGLGPPDSNKPIDRQSQKEAAQRVEKVGEVDPDEQARQQRFQQIMQSDSESAEGDSLPLPSPFDLSGARQNSTSNNLGADQVPSSSYSPPPSVSASSSSSSDTMSDEDLPQSDQFWTDRDLPGQPIGKPRFQEQTTSPQKMAPTQKGGKERSILGPPGKPDEKTSHTKSTRPLETKKPPSKSHKDEETPQARYWTSDHDASNSTRPSKTEGNNKKGSRETSISLGEETLPHEQAAIEPSSDKFRPLLKKKQQEEEEHRKAQQHKKNQTISIISPSLPELPSNAQPAAIAATQAAASYLKPETVPLFYQMIGSIIVMSTPPGVSRTEFLLNNPAFANSKFFGASVELIKYSTAPDSYNIRLSGSNEAVAAFNQNIPSLMAAFQTGQFSFRVGRIDAEYSADRPVLRRKESTEGGNDQESKKGNK